MKAVFTIVCVCLVVHINAQTIRRVNNNPGITGPNIFTTIQAAHDAAVSGDIIYVEPSGMSYGNLVCTKRLTIVGVGYFLNNQAVYLQADLSPSTLGTLTFRNGSQNSQVVGISASGSISIHTSNISILRCHLLGSSMNSSLSIATFDGTNHQNIDGIRIDQNWILRDLTFVPSNFNNTNFTIGNVVINNNFIFEVIRWAPGVSIQGVNPTTLVSNVLIQNNYIGNTFFVGHTALHSPTNAVIQNNVLITEFSTAQVTYTNCTVLNNFSNGSQLLPGGNGNVNSVDIVDLFVGPHRLNGVPSRESFLQLRPNSFAAGAGVNGVDLGIFGGPFPYVNSGIPPYPIVNSFITTGEGSNATPLSVTISTRSNN